MNQFDTFRPLSATHALVVLVFLIVVVGLVRLGRWLRQKGIQQRLDYHLAAISMIGWLIINTWAFLPVNFDPETSWPLHFCDVVAFVVPLVLIWPARWLRAVLYYWGLGLCTQGFITPGIDIGPAHFGFWTFWANHFIAVGASLYDVFGRGYRPEWGDFLVATTLGVVYAAMLLPIDLSFGLNYGYVGPGRAEQASLLDLLGPWPFRLLILVALGYLVMALLTLPWALIRRRSSDLG